MVKKEKTRTEKRKYILSRKTDSIGIMTRRGREYIYFRKDNKLSGLIARDEVTESVVKKNIGMVIKIQAKRKDRKKPITYKIKIYNKKQQKQLLFRMNENLRNKTLHKREQRKLGLPDTNFRKDAIPRVDNKTNIDMLFDKDKIEFKPIEKLKEYQSETP